MKDEHWSGLTARFKLASVDNVQATVSLTANVGFWKEAARALEGESFGAWQVRAAIRSVIEKAEAEFYDRVAPDAVGADGRTDTGETK